MMSMPPNTPEPSAAGGSQNGPQGTPGPYGQSSPGEYGQPAGGQYGQPSPNQYGQPAAGQYGQPSPSDPFAQPAPAEPAAGAGAPAYGPAPGTDLGTDLGEGLKFAGTTMVRNPAAYLLSGLVYVVAIFLVIGIGTGLGLWALFSSVDQWAYSNDEVPWGPLLMMYGGIFGGALLSMPLALMWQSGAGRSGLVVLEGGRPSIGQALIGPMRVFLTALLVGVLTFIGYVLLIIPGLIVTVMAFYAIPAAVRGASPVEAIKESFALARENLGTTIVAWLVLQVVATLAGAIMIGILVLAPFVVLFQLGMYERLKGRQLPDPARG